MAVAPTTSSNRAGLPGSAQGAILATGRGAREFLRLSLSTTAGRIGLPIVIIHIFVAIFGSMVAPYTFDEFHDKVN